MYLNFKIILFLVSVILLHPDNFLFPGQIKVGQGYKVTKISRAVELASDYDTIIVYPGYYSEGNIIITRPVAIIGINSPVIDGEGIGEVLTVSSSDVLIEGFIIKNAGVSFLKENSAIKLDAVRNCKIINNKLIDNFFGIYISESSDCLISGNFIKAHSVKETNSGNGIHLWYCKNIRIVGNNIKGHRDGIYFEFVENGYVHKNHSSNNLRYGLHFMFSDNCVYSSNIFEKNGAGVAVMYTKNVTIKKNIFRQNPGPASYGILLKEITDCHILNNEFYSNTTALYFEGCSRITTEGNIFSKNGWAIRLMANSMNNYFYRNNFLTNSFDVATNSRQNFNEFRNNYWSEYSGYDLDKDGKGDVPYRPVKFFSVLVQEQPASLALLHSLFADLLNLAESVVPSLTPEHLVDTQPSMRLLN
ncbi:MAG: right-handed parallel beta-helix repeat-containing protein [Ignavibacteriaceae bacterium]